MKPQARAGSLAFWLAVTVVVQMSAPAEAGEDLVWKADYFPSFADRHTVVLWLFDETAYRYNTLTDAGIYEYDLRLFNGDLVPGKFGAALKTSSGSDYNLYYAEWAGKVSQKQMRRPNGESSGLWGPTVAPEKLLAALAGQDWTIEFWVKCLSRPSGEAMVLDVGHAYDPGLEIRLDVAKDNFHVKNAYAGMSAFCASNTTRLLNGQWHHIAFTWSASDRQPRHYVDGRVQPEPHVSSLPAQPIPQSIIPSSFVEPEGYDLFDNSAEYGKFRKHRFNLSLGEDRHGAQDFHGMFDELRISNIVRYSGDFDTPGSFARNYGPNAPEPAVSNGPALLFAPDSPRSVVRLNSRKHLFIDDALLDSVDNLVFVCNPPTDRRALDFRPEKSAWRPSVVDVDGKVYMYIPESYGSHRGNTRLRISEDGIHFSKPDLGLYEYEGPKRTIDSEKVWFNPKNTRLI